MNPSRVHLYFATATRMLYIDFSLRLC